ncbi:MAG: type II secretion system F family protein [Gammaproteobacteria bacterium]|nr:type II secretion system F family protein [Gammaproteobacteria bacterium]
MKKHGNLIYDWSGVGKENQTLSGNIKANSLRAAKVDLMSKGILIKRIRRRRAAIFTLAPAIKAEDILFISRQIAVMIAVGIPLSNILKSIAKGSEKKTVNQLLTDIRSKIDAGTNLSDALKLHPNHFDKLYVGLVSVGEESGTLDAVMDQVATYLEKTEHIKGKMRSALIYPALVMVVAIAIITLLLIVVIPEFENLFAGFGSQLPALTQKVIFSSYLIRAYWEIILIFLTTTGCFTILFYHRSEAFQKHMDRLALHFPITGKLHRKSVISRITSTLSVMSGAGIPLISALDTISRATGNRVYTDGLTKIKQEISSGKSLSSSMENSHLFPPMVLQMVSTGEESGELEIMLEKVTEFYEQEIDVAVESIGRLIEPILIIFLGIVVGTIVIAMYLPVFQSGAMFR